MLVETVYWSVDPYVRVQMAMLPLNSTIIGENIARLRSPLILRVINIFFLHKLFHLQQLSFHCNCRVIESKDSNYPIGSYVWSFFGWRDYTIFNNNSDKNVKGDHYIAPYVIESIEKIPLSARLGVLGMTGLSAYFGLLELCAPKPNKTIVISAAAGAVGSVVGQIGKIIGCRVIGIAGSDAKCQWLKEELNFDGAINYKKDNIAEYLKEIVPNGIDVYFDNVGGDLSSIVMRQMNEFGRVAVCGSISTYNSKSNLIILQLNL